MRSRLVVLFLLFVNCVYAENLADTNTVSRKVGLGKLSGRSVPKWRLGLQGGFAYSLAQISNRLSAEEARYLKGVKTGFSIGGDVGYYFWKNTGLGARYDLFRSWNNNDRQKDNVSMQFIGSSVFRRIPMTGKRNSLVTGFLLGYQTYENYKRQELDNFNLKGNSLGWGVDLSLERKLNANYAVGFGATCFLGSVYKFRKESRMGVETIQLKNDEYENLARVELTLALRFVK